jgi:hypothetical protein
MEASMKYSLGLLIALVLVVLAITLVVKIAVFFWPLTFVAIVFAIVFRQQIAQWLGLSR